MKRSLCRYARHTRALREGCPTSPPLFTAYHAAVLNDYEIRRREAAEDNAQTPGIKWAVQMDDKLGHNKGWEEEQKAGGGLTNKQVEETLGTVCFADGTATIAEPDEA